MEDVIGILAIAGLCLGIPAAAVGLMYIFIFGPQRRKRRREMAGASGWAQEHGWRHVPSDNSLVKRWRGEPFKGKGGTEDLLYGTHRGRSVLMFHYGYNDAGVVMNTLSYYTVVTVTLPAPRPWLQVKPRDSAASEEFGHVFEVSSDNQQFAATVLNAELANWMLSDSRAREYPLRFEGNELLSWIPGGVSGDEALAMADYLLDFADRLPEAALR
ncbi:MAG: hypothetical protein ACRD0P_07510 [Stackebrandtia sp.]